MWYKNNFFKYAVGITLILLILLLFYDVRPLFTPLLDFLAVFLIPIILAGLLYYLLRPLVLWVEKLRLPRFVAILFIYLLLVSVILILNFTVGSEVARQLGELTNLKTGEFQKAEAMVAKVLDTIKFRFISPEHLQNILTGFFQKINTFASQFVLYMLSTLTTIAIAIILTPFVLFYFLKDDYLFPAFFLRFVPGEYQEEASQILREIDDTLSTYILGQFLISFLIGSLLYIGYLIIGLPHALILALFAVIFYFIPFLGLIISLIPALIVALSVSLMLAFKVILVMVGAHIIETNLITPNIIGHRLQLHPLMVIFVLLAAGYLYGLIGLLLATPLYAVIRLLVLNLYKIYRLRYATPRVKTTKDKGT